MNRMRTRHVISWIIKNNCINLNKKTQVKMQKQTILMKINQEKGLLGDPLEDTFLKLSHALNAFADQIEH